VWQGWGKVWRYAPDCHTCHTSAPPPPPPLGGGVGHGWGSEVGLPDGQVFQMKHLSTVRLLVAFLGGGAVSFLGAWGARTAQAVSRGDFFCAPNYLKYPLIPWISK
jgi:hypothetical protein